MIKYFTILLTISLVHGLQSPTKIQDLVENLFKNYVPTARPNNEEGFIGNVSFGISPVCLYYSSDGELSGTIWYRISWFDSRLKWCPQNDVELLSISSEMIWKPDIVPYLGNDIVHDTNALIYPSGKVIYIPKVSIKIQCPENNTLKPLNEKSCLLKFGSWTYDAEMMNIQLHEDKEIISLEDYADSKCPVKLLPSKGKRRAKKYPGFPKEYAALEFDLKFVVKKNIPE